MGSRLNNVAGNGRLPMNCISTQRTILRAIGRQVKEIAALTSPIYGLRV
jgi:hypothetical protein